MLRAKLSAKSYAKAIRGHWGIENKLHYVKDTAFREDSHIKRINPYIFSFLIDFCLNIIRSNNTTSIRQFLFEASLNFKNILNRFSTTSTH